MMSFLTYITGFIMNFELSPIMQIRKKGGWNLKKSSPLKLLCPAFQNTDQDGRHSWT